MVKAIVFDLDDTLISEKEYIKSGYRHIAEIISQRNDMYKNKIFSDLMQLFSESSQKVFNRLYEKYHIEYSKEMILDLVNEYRGHFPDIQFYDDVMPCLNKLKGLGIKTGIITDGYILSQRQKLKAVEADKYFDEIIVTDELGRDYWKPHPMAFELIKDRFEVSFDEMVYVGDNPQKDFYINNIYPIKTVRIFREGYYLNRNYLEGVNANYYIYNLKELYETLEQRA